MSERFRVLIAEEPDEAPMVYLHYGEEEEFKNFCKLQFVKDREVEKRETEKVDETLSFWDEDLMQGKIVFTDPHMMLLKYTEASGVYQANTEYPSIEEYIYRKKEMEYLMEDAENHLKGYLIENYSKALENAFNKSISKGLTMDKIKEILAKRFNKFADNNVAANDTWQEVISSYAKEMGWKS